MAHRLIEERDEDTGLIQGIECHGWTIKSKKTSICNSTEMENLQKEFGIPPPEMVFGNNYVQLEKGAVKFEFNAHEALRRVNTDTRATKHITVSYASKWAKNSSSHQADVKDVIKPYDWTYSSDYRGSCNQTFETTDECIDREQLTRQDPILFYNENVMYEDELADNGTAVMSIRLRVMPSCFLVLQRFFLRVDDVLFRINDTRVYHAFGSSVLVREFTSCEDTFEHVSKKLKGDVSKLNDANWVASVLPEPSQLVREAVQVSNELINTHSHSTKTTYPPISK